MMPFLKPILKSHDPKKPKPSSRSSSLDNFNLPNDLLIEILKRLPLKSLIRSTCVCKSWLSLLTSPTFISIHVSHNFTTTNSGDPKTHLFKETMDVHMVTWITNFSIVNRCDLFKKVRHHQIECPVGRNHFVVGSRDGLFCLFDFYSGMPETTPLFLWNPSIGKTVFVPVPFNGFVDYTSGGFPKLIFGFGFDSPSSSYKLVRVAYFKGSGSGVGTCFRAQVYDLGLKKWRILDVASMSFNLTTIRWRGLYMNGVIHWVCNVNANASDNGGICRSILTFKLGSEDFGEIKLPKEVGDAMNQTVRLVMVPKCSKELFGVIHNVGSELSLWVMEQYDVKESWVKLFNINTGGMIRNDMNVALLSDELVFQLSSGGWICYNCKTKKTRDLAIKYWSFDYVDTYVESLLLLDEKDGVLPRRKQQKAARRKRDSKGEAKA